MTARPRRIADPDTVVTTRSGDVRGMLAGATAALMGIPFAAAPFGSNRFRPPQPVEPWSGVLDATTFGADPPALADPQVAAFVPNVAVAGEDSLDLDVWTPEPGSGELPVMVWFTGGFFEYGSGRRTTGSGSPGTGSCV